MSSTDFLFVLILTGCIQGVITGCLLYFMQPYRLSNRLLALIVWLIALPGIHLFAHHAGFFNHPPLTDWVHAFIPWVPLMVLGPFIYWYLQAVSQPGDRSKSISLLHFVPAVIDLFPKMIELLFLIGLLPVAWIPDSASLIHFTDIYNRYADLPRWLSLAYYVYLCSEYIKHHRLNPEAASIEAPMQKWAVSFIHMLRLLVLIWLLYLVPYLLPGTSTVLQQSLGWFPVYIPLATLIYWIGITGYRTALTSASNTKNATPATTPGYSTEMMEQTASVLIERMKTNQLFLDPGLDLSQLARQTDLSAKLISATVNQYLNRSFSQFVNEFRVKEFQRRVALPEADNLTLAGLAASCGFSSQATFQRVFKQITGVTPAGYRKKGQSVA